MIFRIILRKTLKNQTASKNVENPTDGGGKVYDFFQVVHLWSSK